VIPTDWNRVNAVFQVFCEIGEIDPDADRWENSYDDDSESNRECVKRLWDAALEEEPDPLQIPRPTPPHPESTLAASGGFSDDPWATGSTRSGFSDDPPF
jgi:hypothetical protein